MILNIKNKNIFRYVVFISVFLVFFAINCFAETHDAFRLIFDHSPDKRVVGYELRYDTSDDFENATIFDLRTRNNILITGWPVGPTYYFQVRAYGHTRGNAPVSLSVLRIYSVWTDYVIYPVPE